MSFVKEQWREEMKSEIKFSNFRQIIILFENIQMGNHFNFFYNLLIEKFFNKTVKIRDKDNSLD